MKKLLTFLTLLTCIVGGVNAQTDPTYKSDFTDGQVVWTTSNYVDAAITAGWMKMNSTLSKKDLKGKKLMDPETNAEASAAQYSSSEYFYVQKTFNEKASSDKSLYLYVKNLSSITFYFYQNSDGDGTRTMTASNGENSDATSLGSAAVPSGTRVAYFSIALNGSQQVIRLNASNELLLTAIKVGVAPSAPKITTQPKGASYVIGQTISPLTVVATASAGNLSYQWYSCDDANKTNAATINGATNASYTPTAAGFYYVAVTDDNGSVESDVVEVSISAAEAPTITVSGTPTAAVIVGAEVTLTASATGNPTPTIKWFDGSNTEVGEGETYSPSTATVGTYTFYAVASNGVGTDATSEIQTIVVMEQVAKPTITPNGAYFEDSQEVTLACETEGATILYSTDDGATWNTYTAAHTFTETTTLKAKAAKDGMIDSEVATATFNKVELVDQASINGATTWDWSKYGTKEINTSGTPFYRTDVLVANVAKYGYAAPVAEFGPADALIISGDYIVRDSKYCQVTKAQFTTTVPGMLKVVFSNTGSNRPYRYLYVNGKDTGFGSNVSNSNTTASNIYVPAGGVELTAIVDPTSDDSGAGQPNFIRIYSIEFSALPESTTVKVDNGTGYRTFASKYPTEWSSVSGVTAYTASVSGSTVSFKKVNGAVPAGVGLLLKADDATVTDAYTVPIPTATPADVENALIGVTKETEVDGGIFVLMDDDKGVGFYKTTAEKFTVGANTAYLPADVVAGARTFIGFDGGETTAIEGVSAAGQKLNGEVYNLQGLRVEKAQKGLYIVNGKKMLVK